MRKRFKIPIGVLLVFMLAVAVTLVVIVKTNFLERQANELLKRNLEKKYGLQITLGDIGGSIFSGFHVSDIEVKYESGEGLYRIAAINYIDVEYNLYDLLRSQWIVHRLLIDSLRVTARKCSDGSLDIPDFAGDGGSVGGGAIDFAVEKLLLMNSSFALADRSNSLEIDEINVLLSLTKDKNRYQAEIDTCWMRIPSYDVTLRQLTGTYTLVDSIIEAEDVRVVTDSSTLSLASTLTLGSDLGFDASLTKSHVNFPELSRIIGVNLEGAVEVVGNVDRHDGVTGASLVIDGLFRNWEFAELKTELTLVNKMITVSSVSGGAFGAKLNGRGSFNLGSSPECYQFAGTVENLSLSGAVEGSYESSLTGSVVLDGCALTRDELTLDFDLNLGRGKFDAYSFDSLSGSCRVTSDSIIFRYPFDLFYRSTSLSAGGRIEYSGDMNIEGQANLPVIDQFKNQIFLRDIGGRGSANVMLSGPTADPAVTGDFTSDSVRIYDFTSRDFYCLLDVQHFFSSPAGGVEIFSEEFDYSGLQGQWAYASLGIEPDIVFIENVTASMEPSEIHGVGMLEMADDSLLLRFNELTVDIDSEKVSIADEAIASITDAGIKLVALDLSSGTDRVNVRGDYLYDGSLDLVLGYDDLLMGKWLPYFYDEYVIAGRLSGDGIIKGNLLDPILQFDLSVGDMSLGGEKIGDLSGLISYADSSLTFRGVTLRGVSDTTEIEGYVPLDLTFQARESRLLKDEPIDLNVSIIGVAVDTWLPYFYEDYKIGGRLSANGKVYGSLLDPMFRFNMHVNDMTLDGEVIGELSGQVSYSDSSLALKDLSLESEVTAYALNGYLPIDLTIDQRDSRLLDQYPMNLAVSVTGSSFDLVDEFFSDVEWLEGSFVVDAILSGTPADMYFDGSIRVDKGRCKLYYIEDPITDMQFRGVFDGRSLTVNRLEGKLARNKTSGEFSASGSIDLTKPNYAVRIQGTNLPVKYDLGEIEVRIGKLDLSIEGSDPPAVTGDVNLVQMLYEEPFYDEIVVDALAAADTVSGIDYNIHIDIPQNMWIRNEDADVELKGSLIVLKEGSLENFLGTLETIRGKVYLAKLGRSFTVLSGGTITFDEIATFNPRLDIQMTTTVRDSTGMRDVCMQLTRTLNDPNIDVCPGSDLSIDEVWVYMNPIGNGFGDSAPSDTTGGGGSSLGGRLSVGAAGIASSQVSRLVSRRLGVETFELNTTGFGRTLNPLETELTIGFYTTPRLYIYGTSQLTFGRTEELGFDYRLSNRVFISGQRDRDNLYHLNLNLNWEFK
ncbi:MAG: translocation/assembly module TamB domain-containing protein [Candidatus Zixiibacteriota bacterium]